MARWGRLGDVERGLARWCSLVAAGTAAVYSLAAACSLTPEDRSGNTESAVADTLYAERSTWHQCSGKGSVQGEWVCQRVDSLRDVLPGNSPSSRQGGASEAFRGVEGPGAASRTRPLQQLVHVTWHSTGPCDSTLRDSSARPSREGLTLSSVAERGNPSAAPPARGAVEIPVTTLPAPASPAPPSGSPSRPAPGGPEATDPLRSLPSSPSPLPASIPSPGPGSPSGPSPVPGDRGSSSRAWEAHLEAREYVRRKAQSKNSGLNGPLPAVSAATKGDQVRGP